jgi:peptidoglycan/xylan/chitin deacetylase (PgdA/CDA1 family)
VIGIADRTWLRQHFSVNVDVDSIRFYHQIHGLAEPEPTAPDPVWYNGVPRFLQLFETLALSATFFVVASDLVTTSEGGSAPNREEAARRYELVQSMLSSGHTVGSHSFSHAYDLSRQDPASIRADLVMAREVLDPIGDKVVSGFRAPGNLLSSNLLTAVLDSGARYSSSRLPSPPYFTAKYLAMLRGIIGGRSSRSIVGDVVAPFTSRLPYWHRVGLLELPISVISPLRLPAVGTFLTLYRDFGRRRLLPRLLDEDWINVEFHGIDLVDSSDEGVAVNLSGRQPDLRDSLSRKSATFHKWLGAIAERRKVCTLEEVARTFTDDSSAV